MEFLPINNCFIKKLFQKMKNDMMFNIRFFVFYALLY